MKDHLDVFLSAWPQLSEPQRLDILQDAELYAEDYERRLDAWKNFFDYLLSLGEAHRPPKNPTSNITT